MVDAILEIERLKRIVGLKNVSINEPFFQGHFPGKPVMPGVLIIEGMAQTGGLLLLSEVPDRDRKLLYLAAVDEARFRRPVVPGDQLRMEVTVLKWQAKFCKLQAVATVNGEVAAEATCGACWWTATRNPRRAKLPRAMRLVRAMSEVDPRAIVSRKRASGTKRPARRLCLCRRRCRTGRRMRA